MSIERAHLLESKGRRHRQPPPSWYLLSWRGLRSSALTPESFGLSNPETTPTQFQPPPRRDRNVRPHHRGQDRPDSMMLVRADPRQPQTPFVPIGLERSAAFCWYIALRDRVAIVRHFIPVEMSWLACRTTLRRLSCKSSLSNRRLSEQRPLNLFQRTLVPSLATPC